MSTMPPPPPAIAVPSAPAPALHVGEGMGGGFCFAVEKVQREVTLRKHLFEVAQRWRKAPLRAFPPSNKDEWRAATGWSCPQPSLSRRSWLVGPQRTERARAAPKLRLWLANVIAAAALNASCLGPGTTESLRYYVLSPVVAEQPVGSGQKRMGIMPVRLPGYLDRPALIERRGTEIFPHRFSAWAAPLDQEFSRVLAENLQRAYPGSEVEVFPWRRSFTPDQRLDIDVGRFEVENGAALLHARWRLLGANGDGVAPASEARISVPVAGKDDQARVAALSVALGQFSAAVANSLGR